MVYGAVCEKLERGGGEGGGESVKSGVEREVCV